MKIYYTLMPFDVIKGKSMHVNTIICELDNGLILACPFKNFLTIIKNKKQKKKNDLIMDYFIPTKNIWVQHKVIENQFTKEMWTVFYNLYKKSKKKEKCNFAELMKHERRHKKTSGFSTRDNVHVITDYECSKNPLHDFRRYYN